MKIEVEVFLGLSPFNLESVPWCGIGFHYQEEASPSKHPFHAAGLYYIQEPSAMAVKERIMAYSTCTFSQQENEAIVDKLLHAFPQLELLEISNAHFYQPGFSPWEKCARLWPHKLKGLKIIRPGWHLGTLKKNRF